MKKLFVVVRKDLSHSQRAVQAGHALAEYMLNSSRWKNSTLIYLGVRDLRHLENIIRKLERQDIEHYVFYEPDIDQITALASDEECSVFNKLNLL